MVCSNQELFCTGQQAPPLSVRPQHSNAVTVAAVKMKAVVIMGEVGGMKTEIVVDSGSSLSIVRKEVLHRPKVTTKVHPALQLQLITA